MGSISLRFRISDICDRFGLSRYSESVELVAVMLLWLFRWPTAAVVCCLVRRLAHGRRMSVVELLCSGMFLPDTELMVNFTDLDMIGGGWGDFEIIICVDLINCG